MLSSSFKRVLVYTSAGMTLVGGGVLLKDQLGGQNFHEIVDLEGKVAIVTGGSSGIGTQVATGLAKRGAKVILACRDRDRCEKARENVVVDSQNKYVYCRYCDLASQDSIVRFARRINNEMEKVDILVNNAGIMSCPKEVTKEGIEMQLGVNHMGHFLLTNLILDKLKAGAPSRIVNLTSIAYKKGKINVNDLNSETSYSPDMAYNQSCLANVLFTRELAKKLEGSGVTVNAVNPGITDTNIMKHKNAGYYLTKWVTYPFTWPFIKSARQGAQVVLHVALSKKAEGVTGQLFGSHREVEAISEEGMRDDLAKWLWMVDEKWTKLDENLVQSKLPIQKKPKTNKQTASEEKTEQVNVVPPSKETQESSSTVISGENTRTTEFTNPLSNVSAA